MIFKNLLSQTAILSLLLWGMVGCKSEDRNAERQHELLDSLTTELAEQRQRNDSLQRLVEQDNGSAGFPIYFGRGYDTIPDPKAFISNALKEQQELIPMEGVLGGTMDFRQVEVISDKWILALYDDGHVQGKSIYEYELKPGGEMVLKEVAFERPN